jgi:serine/threonine-protein kinase
LTTLINQTIGNYKVIKLLGEGGMGAVYLGEHPIIGRKVAIKVLHVSLSRDTDIVGRFFNEARAIHTIGHQNIVEILDFGQTPDGQPYFTMEYLTGESLNDRVSRGAMPPAEVAELADQICRALSAAHVKGVIHRDLKPHNIQILQTEEGRPLVKLLDFGVAKILSATDTGGQSVKTRTGSLMGTPLYMSPEQCRGSGTLDHRTDVYSLGVMLFEMLAGRPPFIAEGVGELFAMHMLEAPPSLLAVAPHVPPHMAAAIMRALSKSLNDRFATMEDFRIALLGGGSADAVKVTSASRGMAPRPSVRATPGGTVALTPQSTTFSSASSEIDDELMPPRRRSGLVLGVVALAAVAVVGVIFFKRSPPPVEPAVATPTPAAPRPVPAAPPAPPAPTLVTIRLEASPSGVHVIRASDDKDLGAVPVEVKVPRGSGKSAYLFKLDGYKDKALSADATGDRTMHVALEKEPPPPTTAPPPAAVSDDKRNKRPAAPSKPRPAHRPRANPDEDGLATPSF